MAQHSRVPVTIKYDKTGTDPPLFLAGTFSDPPWQPVKMNCSTDDDGRHVFHKSVQVPPGSEIQYKIRIGHGDWWVLNEDAPVVTDNDGNQNNQVRAPRTTEHEVPPPVPKGLDVELDRERLSSTPIGQVADTAAAVADSAQKIDKQMDDDYDNLEGAEDHEPPPLFAHECLGAKVPYIAGQPSILKSEEALHSGSVDYDIGKYDLNDPTLERWPSDRRSVMDAVRKIETGRNEDQTLSSGAAISPVFGSARLAVDSEAITTEDESSAAAKSEVLRKKSHSSAVSSQSLASLAEIEEEEDPGAEQQLRPSDAVRVASPVSKQSPGSRPSPRSDEDEGVVFKTTRPKAKGKRADRGNRQDAETASSEMPDPKRPGQNVDSNRMPDPPFKTEPNPQDTGDPKIQVQPPDEMDELEDTDDEGGATVGLTAGQLAQRASSPSQGGRPTSPASIHSNRELRDGNWLNAFFRVVFVDWIGAFFGQLFGGRRRK